MKKNPLPITETIIKLTALAPIFIIAGSDPSGGAGIQADIKTVTSLGGYAMAAITALTAQNSQKVTDIHVPPALFLKEQIQLVLEDITPKAIKTGMLFNKEVVDTLVQTLPKDIPLVIDPVMVASSGAILLEKEAIHVLKTQLIPKATLITPNIPEAELLIGKKIHSLNAMQEAGKSLLTLGTGAVLLKGGHLPQEGKVTNILFYNDKIIEFTTDYINTHNTHGSGCTLASAIATLLGGGKSLPEACEGGGLYVHAAIQAAPGYGRGHGPLTHNYALFT